MSTFRLTRLSSSGVMGSFWRSAGEVKRDIATSPSPERETFHFWEVDAASSVWRADSGSRDFFSGVVEGVGEMVVMLGDGSGLGFQMAILMEG